jgi:hypothetical protein
LEYCSPFFAVGALLVFVVIAGVVSLSKTERTTSTSPDLAKQSPAYESPSTPEVVVPKSNTSKPVSQTTISPPINLFPSIARAGDVEISPLTATVGKVRLSSFGEDEISKENLLILTFKVTNRSSTRRVEFDGWASHGFRANCSCFDEHGNAYKNIHFGLGSKLARDQSGEAINPGQSAIAVVVFEHPIDAARVLTVSLDGSGVNLPSEDFAWTIRRDQWVRR